MVFIPPPEFKAASRRGDQRRAVLLLRGDGGGGERWKHSQVGVRSSRAAPVGLLRPQQLGTAGGQRQRPSASLQRSDEDLQALVEPVQEGRAEELLRCPPGEDRFLQWTGMLKMKVGTGERYEWNPPVYSFLIIATERKRVGE